MKSYPCPRPIVSPLISPAVSPLGVACAQHVPRHAGHVFPSLHRQSSQPKGYLVPTSSHDLSIPFMIWSSRSQEPHGASHTSHFALSAVSLACLHLYLSGDHMIWCQGHRCPWRQAGNEGRTSVPFCPTWEKQCWRPEVVIVVLSNLWTSVTVPVSNSCTMQG